MSVEALDTPLPPNVTRLEATFRVLTPMYLGGAEQQPELRAPSIRGALRFWYRAVDPRFGELLFDRRQSEARREDLLFGGPGGGRGGQSALRLSIAPTEFRTWAWDKPVIDRFTSRDFKYARNGVIYLGFPFARSARQAIAPGTTFTLRCLFLSRPGLVSDEETRREIAAREERARRGLLAALWALGRFGGLGSRSRRGFGSVDLVSWSADGNGAEDWRQDLSRLRIHETPPSPGDWLQALANGLTEIRRWLGRWPDDRPARHAHVGNAVNPVLWGEAFRGDAGWLPAMNRAGRLLQDYRQLRAPDYGAVKAHLEGTQRLRATPKRAVFGLPLIFRYSSLGGRSLTLVPRRGHERELDRHASPLMVRVVSCSDGFHPLFTLLSGPIPGNDPPAAVYRESGTLDPVDPQAIHEFFQGLVRR